MCAKCRKKHISLHPANTRRRPPLGQRWASVVDGGPALPNIETTSRVCWVLMIWCDYYGLVWLLWSCGTIMLWCVQCYPLFVLQAQMIPAQQEALAVSPPTCQYPPGIEPPPAYTFTRMDPAYPPDEKIPPEERYGHAPGGVTNPAYATPEITTTPPPAPPGHTPAPYSMDAYTGGEAPVNSPPPVYEVIDTAYTHYRSDDQSTSAPGEVDPVSQSAVQLTTVDGWYRW